MYVCMYVRIYVQRWIQRFKGGCTIRYNNSRFYLDFAEGLQVTSKVTLVGMRGTTMLRGSGGMPRRKIDAPRWHFKHFLVYFVHSLVKKSNEPMYSISIYVM